MPFAFSLCGAFNLQSVHRIRCLYLKEKKVNFHKATIRVLYDVHVILEGPSCHYNLNDPGEYLSS